MNLWQRIGGLFQEKRAGIDPRLFELMIGGAPSYAGPPVNEESAMRYSAVYACVRIISESIASLPLVLFRHTGRSKNKATAHPLYPILHNLANPLMTAFEWRELAMSHVALTGNHWSEIEYERGNGRITALWPLNPSKMEGHERRDDGIWWRYRQPDNQLTWFKPGSVHHIKGLGDGIMGISPIAQAARQATGLGLATEEFGARFFSNGARPGIVLKHPKFLSSDAMNKLKASWNADHGGLSQSHRVKILEEGMDIATIGVPPNEAQFLETRKFQVTEIARIYRVPPHMLADLDRATFSNIEHQSLSFVMHTLMPWLVRHEQAIYRDLLLERERGSYFVKYQVGGLLRGDVTSRYQAYTTGITNGFLTRNEARELEDLNPIDGLDEPLLPLNMVEANNPPPPQPLPAPTRAPLRLVENRADGTRRDRQAIMNRTVRLFEDAASRVVTRETSAIRKAARNRLGKRDTESFQTWLESFYRQLRTWFPDYFRAILLAYAESILASVAAELGGEPAEMDEELREWVEGYLANYTEVYAVGGEKQLRALLAEAEDDEAAQAAVLERMDGWEETKAQKEGFAQSFEAGNALAIYGYVAAGVSFLRWSARGESCPLCRKMDGRRIKIDDAFFEEGDTLTAEGVDPLPIIRTVKHGPLHAGCDCVTIAG